jgi:RNase adapter protein RapZ
VSGAAGLWVITGLSGAGKATALAALERSGVDCVDNLAVDMLEAYGALPRSRAAAAVVDARQHEALERFAAPRGVRVVFLDARDDVLVLRLAATTRLHPCAELGRGREAVAAERALLAPMRAAADVVIDTSEMQGDQLAERVAAIVIGSQDSPRAINVSLSSFGFKYGLPLDAEWMVDARVVRNPFWVPDLRPRTGLDAAVRAYVLEDPVAGALIDRVHDLLTWSVGHYGERGREFLHFAAGCTGGRHRSVVVVEALSARLREDGLAVTVRHRDVDRPDPR